MDDRRIKYVEGNREKWRGVEIEKKEGMYWKGDEKGKMEEKKERKGKREVLEGRR